VEEKRTEFLAELAALEAFLAANGPLFGGDRLGATDCLMAPRLYHARVALREFHGFEFPAEMTALARYAEAVEARPEWKATAYPPEVVIRGWRAKIEAARAAQ